MIVVWLAAIAVGLAASVVASNWAVDAAASVALRSGLSPFLIGVTVLAVGTDLPEIANSISASATGHGDLNVGDSIGSAMTQMTLVVGLLSLTRLVKVDRTYVLVTGGAIVTAVLMGAALIVDEDLGRLDGLLLVVGWIVATTVVKARAPMHIAEQPTLFSNAIVKEIAVAAGALTIVAAGAVLAVLSFTRAADELGLPEYATSFFAFSIGTSLPELVVGARALRQGHADLAIGDILGSSLADATLSIGIGPLLFPVAVSAEAAEGTLAAALVIGLATLVLARKRTHGRRTAALMIGLYALMYPLVLI